MSLGEIEYLARRAALGRGLPYGLAEEAGSAAAWLAAAGLDDGPAIADAVDGVRAGCAGRGNGCGCWNGGGGTPSAALCVGPSIVDRLALPVFAGLAVRLDVPLVLVGMIGTRTGEQGEVTRVRWPAGPGRPVEVLLDAGTILVDAPGLAALTNARDAPVSVTLGAGGSSAAPGAPACTTGQLLRNRRRAVVAGVVLRREAARRLQAHARRSLVPSSTLSRERGAGAGLVDRD